MESSEYHKNVTFEEIQKFVLFENPNNFDNYHVEIISRLSKINNFYNNNFSYFIRIDGKNVKYVSINPIKISSSENKLLEDESKHFSL